MLEKLTAQLVIRLLSANVTEDVTKNTFVGMTFLYITPVNGTGEKEIRSLIAQTADSLTLNRNIYYDCFYVRQKERQFVYRFRFRYPDEKSFCCGNRCPDCIYKRPKI